jgi:uncharacterized protein (DUF2384 family)
MQRVSRKSRRAIKRRTRVKLAKKATVVRAIKRRTRVKLAKKATVVRAIKRRARLKLAKKGMLTPAVKKRAAGPPLWRYLDADGHVAVERLTEEFHMSRATIAETVGMAPATLQRTARAGAPKTQNRLREMTEIVSRVSDWAGGPMQAMAWYRAEPIPAFGGRTAEALVKDGKAAAVRDYLDSVAVGGFA